MILLEKLLAGMWNLFSLTAFTKSKAEMIFE